MDGWNKGREMEDEHIRSGSTGSGMFSEQMEGPQKIHFRPNG